MLTELCRTLNHYWKIADYTGNYALTDGVLTLPSEAAPVVGQSLYIRGLLNDAVCSVVSVGDGTATITSDTALASDTIKYVALLAIPPAMKAISEEIADWQLKNGASAYVSESFGGWSGTKAQGANGVQTWQEHFQQRLLPYKRLIVDIKAVY